jgi:hypothetical protein
VRDLTKKQARLRVVAGDDVAARIDRGELPAAEAITELRMMLDSNDAYLVLGGIAVARSLDRLVAESERASWSAWLAKHAQGMHAQNSKLAEQLTTARMELAPSSFTPTAVKEAQLALDRQLTAGVVSLPLVAIVAPSGGDKLFKRIADRATTWTGEDREAFYEALGLFGPAQAPLVVALLGDASITLDHAWIPFARMLEKPATRAATWRALKPALPALVKRLGHDETGDLVDALASLCEKADRDEVASSVPGQIATIEGGKARLAKTLAAIDQCIASRAKLGDLAGALAR